MKHYSQINTALGWLCFLIASIVYGLTIEPSASFWDCPEFIVAANKLQVGHPPGAPFFMLAANVFGQLAIDASHVSMMVNLMNALLSAACIMFLFWTITHLLRNLDKSDVHTPDNDLAILVGGLTGSMTFMVSDTFWFSATEAEVYAFSSAFTAVVFWLILKWEQHADQPHSDRYLVLMMYLVGLSIGVHLLNLLCLPAIVLVFTYRRWPSAGWQASVAALLVSFLLVAAVLYGLIPGIVTVGGWLELLFVNRLNCPFNTGVFVYLALLSASFLWAIAETSLGQSRRESLAFCLTIGLLGIPFVGEGAASVAAGLLALLALWLLQEHPWRGKRLLSSRTKNTILLCLLMLSVGYSSYAVIMIRSNANTPMDQNSPEDIFTLGRYLSRDQYGDQPLVYGPAYTSQVRLSIEGDHCRPVFRQGAPVWQKTAKQSPDDPDRYVAVTHKDRLVYAQNMWFPRMHSAQHRQDYEAWMGGVKGHEEAYDRCGETMMVKTPTAWENLRFFLSYQCNFMYWRYFLWNFAGRQNDLQGKGEAEYGNWLSGLPLIDNLRLGNQRLMPDTLKQNKGHNVYYSLPLLLGLLGLFWQACRCGREGVRQSLVVTMLFVMTGLAIVVYLNQTPNQARERDYAYAGSFYAFAIWCGMGATAVGKALGRRRGRQGFWALPCLLIPLQMGSQTWDDHNRSGRFVCRDYGKNYLLSAGDDSLQPVIFCNGDNDTFPLWYAQEVEGVARGARVCNTMYLTADWYIDQMRRPSYASPGLPITWERSKYVTGVNDYVDIAPEVKPQVEHFYREQPQRARAVLGDNPYEVGNVMQHWIRSDDETMHLIPTDTLWLRGPSREGTLLPVSLKGRRALYKNDLMMLEILAQSAWKRPVYVASSVSEECYQGLEPYLMRVGLAYQFVPFNAKAEGKEFDVERVYDNVMNRFCYGGLDRKAVYLDQTSMKMCWSMRVLMGELALRLIANGDKERARKVLEKAERVLPEHSVPLTSISGASDLARAWSLLGDRKRAAHIVEQLWKDNMQHLNYYLSLGESQWIAHQKRFEWHTGMMVRDLETMASCDPERAAQMQEELRSLLGNLQASSACLPSLPARKLRVMPEKSMDSHRESIELLG